MSRRPPISTLFPHPTLSRSAQRREVARLDALPDVGDVALDPLPQLGGHQVADRVGREVADQPAAPVGVLQDALRSEEHTSELQSRQYLVCRLLLEKK